MQINAKRFGASVAYNSDTKTFTFLSGTTGETISADGALGVTLTRMLQTSKLDVILSVQQMAVL